MKELNLFEIVFSQTRLIMNKIYARLFDSLEIGDDFPTILMGVLNLSPESFYKGSVYETMNTMIKAANEMINYGALILDLGARSTAPWSKKITIEEEMKRIVPAMQQLCMIIPSNIIISVDTQYTAVAEKTFKIAQKYGKKMILNDVSCLKTDPALIDFIVEQQIPIILMASSQVPGDLLYINDIIKEFNNTIKLLKSRGYQTNLLILDPGIGKWIPEKTHTYDLKIISNLNKLHVLQKPILVAISRKSFIGTTLNISNPELRLNGSLAATAIAVFNGAHIVRTHDINKQTGEIIKMATEIRKNM